MTEEYLDAKKKKQVEASMPQGANPANYRYLFTQHFEMTGPSLSVGGGLDVGINQGLAVRVANLEYMRSWLGTLNGRNFDRSMRFSVGLVLRVGTW